MTSPTCDSTETLDKVNVNQILIKLYAYSGY